MKYKNRPILGEVQIIESSCKTILLEALRCKQVGTSFKDENQRLTDHFLVLITAIVSTLRFSFLFLYEQEKKKVHTKHCCV